MTHYADSESIDQSMTQSQQKMFAQMVGIVRKAGHNPQRIHAANSGDAPNNDALYTMKRTGLALY